MSRDEPKLKTFSITVCELCLGGAGGECHVPGCSFWMGDAPNAEMRSVLNDSLGLAVPSTNGTTEEEG